LTVAFEALCQLLHIDLLPPLVIATLLIKTANTAAKIFNGRAFEDVVITLGLASTGGGVESPDGTSLKDSNTSAGFSNRLVGERMFAARP
jgi:hypothetical protein